MTLFAQMTQSEQELFRTITWQYQMVFFFSGGVSHRRLCITCEKEKCVATFLQRQPEDSTRISNVFADLEEEHVLSIFLWHVTLSLNFMIVVYDLGVIKKDTFS